MTQFARTLNAKPLAPTIAAALVFASCTVGPNYKRPDVSVTPTFRDQAAQPEAASLADLPWWSVFDDKALQGLISQALHNNLDIQVAVARINQAQALVGVAASQGVPQVGYQVFAGGERTFTATPNGAAAVNYGTFGGILNAAWEIDVWGRIRRTTEAARANLLEKEDIRRGVLLTLVSDVAAGYFQLLELDRELAIAQESAGIYKQNLELFTLRFKAGLDNRLPVDRAQANYQASLDRIADLNRAIGQQENVLSILLGGYPKAIDRGAPLVEQKMPTTPLGQTTDLLQRRPDILAAEQTMVSANAQVGVAAAQFFPTIGLSALVGGQSVSVEHAVQTSFSLWNVAGTVAGPIFTGGRLTETLHNRQAYWDETVAQYKETILAAFKETSDALIAQKNLVDRRSALEVRVEALRRAVDLALLRYKAGRADYFEVLDAEEQLFPAEDALAQVQRDQLIAVVNLYKALGGGWKLTPAQWVQSS